MEFEQLVDIYLKKGVEFQSHSLTLEKSEHIQFMNAVQFTFTCELETNIWFVQEMDQTKTQILEIFIFWLPYCYKRDSKALSHNLAAPCP